MDALRTFFNAYSWELECILRLGVAALLGAMIGAEREHHGRSAGFRTQLLVALGSALAMVVSLHFGHVYADAAGSPSIRVDPARVAYGVMGGIGFLGAGAILRHGADIRGVTTAASLWCTAAVGLACGFGMFFVAAAATVIVLFALVALRRLDRIIPARWYKRLTVVLPASRDQDNVARLHQAVRGIGAKVVNVDYVCDLQGKTETISLDLSLPPRAKPTNLMELARQIPELLRITLE